MKKRLQSSRGATMIESAIITPVLLLFILGIFEFGLAFQNYLGVANTVQDAAREATVASDNENADWRILLAAQRGAAALDDGFEQIVIFYADDPSDVVPPACLTASQADLCNRYTPSDFDKLEAEFGCLTPGLVDDPWCPQDRNAVLDLGAGVTPDFIGVYVRTTHDYITGLFGDSIVLEDQIVLRIEPQGT